MEKRRKIWIIVAVVLLVCAVILLLYVLTGCGSARKVSVNDAERTAGSVQAGAPATTPKEEVITPALAQPWLELPGSGSALSDKDDL